MRAIMGTSRLRTALRAAKSRPAKLPDQALDRVEQYRKSVIETVMRHAGVGRKRAEHFTELLDMLMEIKPEALREILNDIYPVPSDPTKRRRKAKLRGRN